MKKNKITADIVKTAIVLLVFFIFANLAFAAPNSINIQGKLTNPSGTILTGTYNFSFSIYDAYTSGNKLYEANITSTTDARGVYDIILNNVNLSFSDQNYLGVKVNNDTEMSPRVNLTSVPYTFRANTSDDLNKNNRYTITGLNITQGLNVTGGLRVSELASCDTIDTDSEGNFYCGSDSGAAASNPWNSSGSNVYQNLLHGSVGIGTASPYNTLTVIGSVGISGSLNASSINTTGSAYFATSSGSVGIGKTSPNYKLDVDGSINATNVTSEVVSAVQLNVGGGFSAGGLTISQDGTISTVGDILFSGNITVLKITHLKVNGSVLPDLDNNFDLGNGSFRWQNANFSGTVQAASFVGDGSSLTGISSSSDSSVWNFANNESAILDNDTIVRAGNTSFVSGIAGWTDDGTVVRLTTGTDSVGIGTTSPTTTLFVEGNVTIVGDLNITKGLNVTGGLRVSELTSCDTIDTDSEGNFYCGSDGGGGGGSDSSVWNFANNETLVLDNDTIIRTTNTTWWTNLYDATADRFGRGNVTDYLGGSGSNASLIRTGNITGWDRSTADDWNFANNESAILDNDTIIRTTNTTWWTNLYDATADRFGNSNFTARYDARTDRFGIENYSSEYSSTGFDNENFTTKYDERDDRYKEGNLSSDLSSGVASTISTTTLTSDTVIVNKNLYVVGNISNTDATNLNINGSLYPALDNLFDLGNGSFRWRNGNLTGTLQAGTLSDGSATITGGVIDAPTIKILGSAVQVEASAFKISNFTSAYDARTDRFGRGNVTDYLGGSGSNASLIRSTNTTFFGLFSRVADAWNFANNESAILDNGTIIRTGNITGWDRSTADDWNFANNESAILDNDTIIRTTNTTWWTNLYDATADRFGNSNFTARYDARTDRFGIENYSSEYSSTGFDNENFTTKYDERDDRYKEGNLSSDLSSGVASTISTTTLTSDTVIVNKNLYVVGNISNTDATNLNINGSLYPALDNLFDLGNGSFRWRNGNLTGTLQAGTLSDGSATITGGVIDAPTIKILGSAVQVEASAFKISNFTSAYDARTDRFGRGNVTDYLGGSGSNASLIRSTNTTFFGLFSRVADAWNFANNESAILDNGTIIRTGNITGWDRSTADDWNFANNESAILDNDTIVRAGNTSFVTAISGWTDDGTVVRLTSGSDSVGIGTSTPSQELDVAGHINVTGTSSNSTFEGDVIIRGTLYGGSPLKVAGGINISSVPSGQDALSVLNSAGQKIFRISREGRLNVTRNAGNTTISSTLFIDAENNRVGVGKTSPTTALDVSGTVTATSFAGDGSSLSGIDTDFTNNSDINVTRFVATTATIDNLKVLTNFSYKILNGCYEDTSIDIEDTGTFCDALPSSNITSVRYADDSWKIQCCVPRDVCFTDSTVTPTDPSTVCNEKDINYSVTSLFYNSRSEWQANCCNDAGSCFEDLLITYGNESTICDIESNTDLVSINYDGSAWKTTCCERMIR